MSLGWPTVLLHSRRSMQKLWCIHANRSSRFLVIGIARFNRIDPKCNQVVPWSLHSHGHSTPSLKISCKSVQPFRQNTKFSRIVADKEISIAASRSLPELTQNVTWSSHGHSTPSLKYHTNRSSCFTRIQNVTDRRHSVPMARPIVRSAKNH